MTGGIKLILEIIDPIIILLIMFCVIILLIMFCVMRWDKSITIIIIVGFIITAAITLIAQISAVIIKLKYLKHKRIQLLRASIYKQEEKLQIITQK